MGEINVHPELSFKVMISKANVHVSSLLKEEHSHGGYSGKIATLIGDIQIGDETFSSEHETGNLPQSYKVAVPRGGVFQIEVDGQIKTSNNQRIKHLEVLKFANTSSSSKGHEVDGHQVEVNIVWETDEESIERISPRQQPLSSLPVEVIMMYGHLTIVYTIGDDLSFIELIMTLRRILADHSERQDILDGHPKFLQLSSTREHPVLPMRYGKQPARWLHIMLQLEEGDKALQELKEGEKPWTTTLIMRDDNAYVYGFMNQGGDVFRLWDKKNKDMVLPDTYNNRAVNYLAKGTWSVDYKSLLNAKKNGEAGPILEGKHLGRKFAIDAVRVLSSFTKRQENDGRSNIFLAGLIVMVCESARMNPLLNRIACGWDTGSGFKRDLMDRYIWSYYSKKSWELRKWKTGQPQYASQEGLAVDLKNIHLVLNDEHGKPGNGDGNGGGGTNSGNRIGGSTSGANDAADSSAGPGSRLEGAGGASYSGGNIDSQVDEVDHTQGHCRPMVELLAIRADLQVVGTKIIVFDSMRRDQTIYRKEAQGEQQELVLTGPSTGILADGSFAIKIVIPADGVGSNSGGAGPPIKWEWNRKNPKYASQVDQPPESHLIGNLAEVTYAVMSNALQATVQVMLRIKHGHNLSGIHGKITARITDFEVGSVLFSHTQQQMSQCFSRNDDDSSWFLLRLARTVVAVPCGKMLCIGVNLHIEETCSNNQEVKHLKADLYFANGIPSQCHKFSNNGNEVQVNIKWYPEAMIEDIGKQKISIAPPESSHLAETKMDTSRGREKISEESDEQTPIAPKEPIEQPEQTTEASGKQGFVTAQPTHSVETKMDTAYGPEQISEERDEQSPIAPKEPMEAETAIAPKQKQTGEDIGDQEFNIAPPEPSLLEETEMATAQQPEQTTQASGEQGFVTSPPEPTRPVETKMDTAYGLDQISKESDEQTPIAPQEPMEDETAIAQKQKQTGEEIGDQEFIKAAPEPSQLAETEMATAQQLEQTTESSGKQGFVTAPPEPTHPVETKMDTAYGPDQISEESDHEQTPIVPVEPTEDLPAIDHQQKQISEEISDQKFITPSPEPSQLGEITEASGKQGFVTTLEPSRPAATQMDIVHRVQQISEEIEEYTAGYLSTFAYPEMLKVCYPEIFKVMSMATVQVNLRRVNTKNMDSVYGKIAAHIRDEHRHMHSASFQVGNMLFTRTERTGEIIGSSETRLDLARSVVGVPSGWVLQILVDLYVKISKRKKEIHLKDSFDFDIDSDETKSHRNEGIIVELKITWPNKVNIQQTGLAQAQLSRPVEINMVSAHLTIVYTIEDEMSFTEFIMALRRVLADHPDREDILDRHHLLNLSSTREHPLLPKQRVGEPARRLHIKLQVVEDSDETSSTTLVMRGDSLFVFGFINQQGDLYELGDPGSLRMLRPQHYNKPAELLDWGVSYKIILEARTFDETMHKLAGAHLGRDFAMRAVRRLSSSIHPDDEVDGLMSARLALAGLIFMVCEPAKMNPVLDSIAGGWSTGTGFTKELITDYVWRYGEMSRRLQEWKRREYAEPHPYSELRAVCLVLNSGRPRPMPARGVVDVQGRGRRSRASGI